MSALKEMMKKAADLGLCDERFLPDQFLLSCESGNYIIKYGWDNYLKTRDFQPSEIRFGVKFSVFPEDEALILLANFGREARREALKTNSLIQEYQQFPKLFQPIAWHGLLFMDRFMKTEKLPQYRQWKAVYFVRSYSRGDRNERILRFGDKFHPCWDSYGAELYEVTRYQGTTFLAKWDSHAKLSIVSKEEARKLDPSQWIKFTENKCYPLNGKSLPAASLSTIVKHG